MSARCDSHWLPSKALRSVVPAVFRVDESISLFRRRFGLEVDLFFFCGGAVAAPCDRLSSLGLAWAAVPVGTSRGAQRHLAYVRDYSSLHCACTPCRWSWARWSPPSLLLGFVMATRIRTMCWYGPCCRCCCTALYQERALRTNNHRSECVLPHGTASLLQWPSNCCCALCATCVPSWCAVGVYRPSDLACLIV